MALYGNVPASDDEDDDLEALRLAALQTLGSKPSSVNTSHITNVVKQTVLHPAGPGRGFRGGFARMNSGRNVFQRHRQNSNLIAIVPVSNEPSPGRDSTQNLIGRGQVDSGVRLELPQDRYCKVEISKDDKLDSPVVSTKFNRYDDSDSDSSAEESAGEDSSDKISASGAEEEDCDVLTVAEDSLDKLMDELEEEMNRSDTNVPVSSSVKPNPEPQKRTKNVVSKSKHDTCDSKNQKSQVGISTSKVVPVSSNSVKKKTKSYNSTVDHRSDLSQLQSSPNCISVTSYPSNTPKNISDKDRNKSSVSQNCILSHKTDTNSQRLFSSNLSRKSRSRSKSQVRSRSRSRSQLNNVAPSKKIRRSRSSSPKGRYNYSPIRSQMPRSPRSRLSRSPVPRGRLSRSPLPRGRLSRSPLPRSRLSRSPVRLARSRSRSPLRSLRSPQRKRYSRSPPWHSPTNSHLSRFSPRRSSSRTRRPVSPRRSPSPRVIRSSPQRSPQSRWWPSPRRSVSPRIRRSPSPLPRHLSPRSRRSSVSPRRPLSPIRRRLSPSPIRRNPSPLRRFSPRRNSPSVRYSRSVSRSPDRFVPRARSPANRNLHHGSPHSLKRRISRSPSPRRRLSHSPFSRLPPRHSPVNRKLSPWSPPKQSVNQRISPISRRYSNSPGDRRRSQSPYGRQKRRSASPVRRQAVSRPLTRSQRSPPREGRRPPQESRVNNVRPRSRSPLPSRQHPDSNIHRSRSPTHARSPIKRSRSPTSSISLSPSPERGTLNNIHRYKSPLRLHASDYRNTIPSLHTSKENCRQRNLSPVQPTRDDSVSSVKLSKTKSGKRKEPRNKTQKRERSREDNKRESDRKSKENTIPERIAVQESPPPKNDNQNDNMINDSKLAILEARKRKFESKGPVKPEAKKIRLKATQPSPPQEEEKQEELEITPVQQELNDILKEEDETSAAITEKSASTLDNSETRDSMDFDLDEPVLELQSGDLWSSEESDSDNEGRFKSSTRIHCSGGAKVTVLPFTKLLDEPKTSTQVDKTASRRKKSVSKKSISEEVFKSKKASSKNKEDLKTSDEGNKTAKQLSDETQERMKVESKISNPSALTIEMESNLEYSAEGVTDIEEELTIKNRECDLRAELSRRRAERLTKAGSLHESLPARLLQNAFEGVVGKKNIKRMETEEKKSSSKRTEAKREKTDGRRVLVLKRPAVAEQRIPSISVTIPKDSKRDLKADSPSAKLPIRMRLGLPSGGSLSEEHLVPRRRNRKVKLKRNVMIGSRPDDKV